MRIPSRQRIGIFYSVIYRHLNTGSVYSSPRGIGISDRRRIRAVATEREEIEPLWQASEFSEYNAPVVKHKDTRSVDEVDPVIVKYVGLLNDLDNIAAGKQKIHPTSFGTIRFDNDNIPQIHGQFDGVAGPDTSAMADHIMKNPNANAQDIKDDENLYLTKQAEKSVFIDAVQNNEVERVKTKPSTVFRETDPEVKAAEQMTGSEKAFEDLFGHLKDDDVEESLNRSSSHDSYDINDTTYMKQKSPDDNHDSSYIDRQFFSDSLLHSNSQSNISYEENTSRYLPKHARPTVNSYMQDIGSTKDLNFIDHTYFKSSLDTLQENRSPAVEYSDIKDDIEKAVSNFPTSESAVSRERKNFRDMQDEPENTEPTSNIALQYLGIDTHVQSPIQSNVAQPKEKKQNPSAADPTPKTAYDYVLKKRKELHDSQFGFNLDNDEPSPTARSYQKIRSLVRERTTDAYTKHEMLKILKQSIIYDKHDVVGLFKPYGVAMHEGKDGPHHILQRFLPELAHHLGTEELHMVHRLDAKTTGVLLLTRTAAMASTLREMFKKHQIRRTYWTITKGIPRHLQGTIDIPIAEGSVDKKHRMVLRPDVQGFRGKTSECQRAVTNYRVLGKNVNSAWVEVTPETGVKHQIRVHLGFGLSCPVLGDHKYSHLKKMAPQKLPGDMLDRLKIQQSKVRSLPMFLHSRSVVIPEIRDGKNVFIQAKLPAFFNKALSVLKLNSLQNAVRYDGTKCIDEN